MIPPNLASSNLAESAAPEIGEPRSGTIVASTEVRLEHLMQLPLFSDLTIEELWPLAQASTIVRFEAEETIVRQDEPGDSMYLILDGCVEVLSRVARKGIVSEAALNRLMSGDALGELALLDGRPRSATCVALVATTCLCLERDAFLEAAQRHWSLTRALLEMVAERLRRADLRLAEHTSDPLTGVNNRRALLELYERESSRAQRAAFKHTAGGPEAGAMLRPLGLLFVDVDQFKQINDTYGHQIGDRVLIAVAQTLVAASRTTDFVARFGGDEFAVLLPDCGEVGLELVSSRIRSLLDAGSSAPVSFTVSLGAALANPLQPESFDELLVEADRRMYADKALSHSQQAVLALD